MSARTTWLTPLPPRGAPRMQLYCLPHAGGGASAYRAWARLVPEDVQVVLVNLPGRESRFAEPYAQHAADVAAPLADAIAQRANLPYALFGHSMGSLLAYETTHALRRMHGPMPLVLFASAHRGPSLPHPRPGLQRLPDAEFLAHIQSMGGMPADVLAHQELLDLVMPVLRADFALCDAYRWTPREPLDVPIVAYGGSEDATVTRHEIDAWAQETRAGYRARLYPGDHFYLATWAEAILQDAADEMRARLPRG